MQESVIMASRAFSLSSVAAFLAIGFSFGLVTAMPAQADEPPPLQVRQTPLPVHRAHPRQRVRVVTVDRVRYRNRYICYDYAGRPFDCRTPAPVAPQVVAHACGGCGHAVYRPLIAPRLVRSYAPYYYRSGCGSCAHAYYHRFAVQPCSGCARLTWHHSYHRQHASHADRSRCSYVNGRWLCRGLIVP
jgi:hypothetical protein